MNADQLIQRLGQPAQLEALYRNDPAGFEAALGEALQAAPHSETLLVWQARLGYDAPSMQSNDSLGMLLVVVLIALVAGTAVKLPAFLPIEPSWYYPRFGPFFVIAALAAYFLIERNRTTSGVVASAFAVCAFALWLLPRVDGSASITMSLLHMPVVLAALLGLAFAGGDWRSPPTRIRFINYAGEGFVLFVLIILGGIVFSGVTISLFALLGIGIRDWYVGYVGVYGAVAAPVVATFVYDKVMERRSRLAMLIANAFMPLFLVMLVIYLLTMFFQGRSPYTDRDFLILFNGLLLLVWGMTVFSVAGRIEGRSTRLVGAINVALLVATLIIDTIALWAISLRLYDDGWTPNRVAVTGANVLIFVHLVWILIAYLRGGMDRLERAVADYLPAYPIWAALVFVFLPILFDR